MNTPFKQFLSENKKPKGILGYFSEIDKISPDLENVCGAYIFYSRKQSFIYPNGKSKVIYIGKSEKLRDRILSHFRQYKTLRDLKKYERTEYWRYTRYFYMLKFDARVAWFTTRGNQTAKQLETDLIDHFYERYNALPVGNGAFSY